MYRLAIIALLLLRAFASDAHSTAFTVRTQSAELGGETVDVDVYTPSLAPSEGVAMLAHGFSRDRSRHRDLGRALAEAGVTAIVPDLPSVADHWGNGDALAGFVRDIERGAIGLPPIPRSSVVLIGTSAGGLATIVAASELPGLAGWIGLDPVDRTGSGARAAARMHSPAVVLLAEPSICNLLGSGRRFADAAPALLRSDQIHGASHCDFEGPTTKFCRAVCGHSSPELADLARAQAVDATLELLRRSRHARANDPAQIMH